DPREKPERSSDLCGGKGTFARSLFVWWALAPRGSLRELSPRRLRRARYARALFVLGGLSQALAPRGSLRDLSPRRLRRARSARAPLVGRAKGPTANPMDERSSKVAAMTAPRYRTIETSRMRHRALEEGDGPPGVLLHGF